MVRIRLFASSYAPLFAILAIRFDDPWLVVGTLFVALVGVVTLVLLLRTAKRIQPDPHHIVGVADRGAEVAGYLATYLLPFVTVSEPSGRDVAAYLGFLLIVGIVYVQSDMIQINPLLYLLRYRVSHVTTKDGWSGYLISRHQPQPDRSVLASRLRNTVALEASRRDRRANTMETGTR